MITKMSQTNIFIFYLHRCHLIGKFLKTVKKQLIIYDPPRIKSLKLFAIWEKQNQPVFYPCLFTCDMSFLAYCCCDLFVWFSLFVLLFLQLLQHWETVILDFPLCPSHWVQICGLSAFELHDSSCTELKEELPLLIPPVSQS